MSSVAVVLELFEHMFRLMYIEFDFATLGLSVS